MAGLFDDEPKSGVVGHPTSEVLEYLKKFFNLQDLRYENLVIHVVGEDIISTIHVLGLHKSMVGIVSSDLAGILGLDRKGLVQHFADHGSYVVQAGEEDDPSPKLLIRRREL